MPSRVYEISKYTNVYKYKCPSYSITARALN